MGQKAKCAFCALRVNQGRCSFQRLVTIGIQCDVVFNYIETPRAITLHTDEGIREFDPEEAHEHLCNRLSTAPQC